MRTTLLAMGLGALALMGCDDTPASSTTPDTSVEDATTDTTADATVEDATPDAATEDAAPDATEEVWTPDPPAGPFGGEARPAAFVLPDDYDPAQAWPLIMVLHGYGANGTVQDAYLGVSVQATDRGFITVIPEGTKDGDGKQFWNATEACCDFGQTDVDDEGYLLGLLDEAALRWHVDPARIYLIGHSNGGFMAYRLACNAADRITAIASIAGSSFLAEGSCNPTAPVGVLQIHGTADSTIDYEGTLGYPGAETITARWADRDGCTTGPTAAGDADYDVAVPGAETAISTWSGCEGGVGVQLWSMAGSAHIPGFDNPTFSDALLETLLSQGPAVPAP